MDVQRNGASGNAGLKEVIEADLTPELRAVFEEVRQVLRVPFVDQLWRVLAGLPEVLPRSWAWLAPLLGSMEAERAADALRAEAAIELALGMPAHQAFRGDMSRSEIGADDRARISNYTAAMHYVLPKLLIATALLSDESQARPADGTAATTSLEPLPRGVVPGAPRVEPIDPNEARGEAAALLTEIRERHGDQPLPDYYRAIVRAGDFLRIAWNALRPIVGDPEYYARAAAVSRRAHELASPLLAVAGRRPDLGLTADQRLALMSTLTFCRDHLLPETLVEITIIKGLTDGPATATASSYSLTNDGAGTAS